MKPKEPATLSELASEIFRLANIAERFSKEEHQKMKEIFETEAPDGYYNFEEYSKHGKALTYIDMCLEALNNAYEYILIAD